MKKRISLVMILMLLAYVILALQPSVNVRAATYIPPANNRVVYNFNLDWKFIKQNVTGAEQVSFDDSSWATVCLPHTFNDVDSYDEWILDASGEANVWEGIVWYRKHFKIEAAYTGRKVFVEFEGVRQAAFVYVNGTSVGRYEHGVTPFGFDITSYVNFGAIENVIAVKIDNTETYKEISTNTAYQWNNRRFNPMYGGLSRNANLYLMDQAYMTLPLYSNLGTTGTYIYPSNISTLNRTADITVESQVKNDSTALKTLNFETVIVDMTGTDVKTLTATAQSIPAGGTYTFTTTGTLTDVKLWEPGYPYLYKVYCILKEGTTALDVYPVTTGFRKADFRGGADTGGVFINNKLVYLSGYAQRSTNEWAGLGGAVPDWMHDFDGQLLRSNNANHLRWMHISAEPVDVRMCDKYGIAMLQPAADHEADVTGRQWEQRKEVMRDTIIYFRNNPSVLFWEAGNNGISDTHMSEMKNIKAQWDPKGMRAMGCRSLSDTAVNYAEYSGTMLGSPYSTYKRDRVPIMEAEYMRDESPRRVWDDYSPPDFDYIHDPTCSYDWTSEQFATQSVLQFNNYYKDRVQGPGLDKFSGAAVLIWADSNQHGRQPKTENCRVSGRVDAVRLPKEAYYAYKVMQSATPEIHIVGHWSYPAGTTKTIYIIASKCAKVELLVNGVSKGIDTTAVNGFEYSFPSIVWESGTIKAVGYDGSNNILCQTEKVSSGPATAIKLTAMTGPNGLRANGEDIVMIDVEVVDSQGRRCPTDQARIDFSMSGPGKWEGGWNSGKQYSVHQTYVDTECGVNRVFVRATRTVGTITFTATRSGLTPASVNITSSAVTAVDGLSTEMQDVVMPTLPPVMPTYGPDGTPTPAPTATPLAGKLTISAATASSEQVGNYAVNSIDGDIATRWAASGSTFPQWLRLDLGSAKTVDQVRLMFYSYDSRTYTYNIEVSSDGTNYSSVTSSKESNMGNQWMDDTFAAVNARYIRINVTACSYSGGYASIYEAEVYNSGVPTSPTPTPTPSTTPTPSPTPVVMYVNSITMGTQSVPPNKICATATIMVVDSNGAAVSGATVNGHWSGKTADTDTGTTDGTGMVIVQSNAVKTPGSGTYTFTVDSVTKAGYAYDAARNMETSDSITIP